ncbi:MAG: hypothetical protein IJ714_06170, partial [Bacteroidales bacterium]|nr:hypothetical protein [Bacteroidales bacterium]
VWGDGKIQATACPSLQKRLKMLGREAVACFWGRFMEILRRYAPQDDRGTALLRMGPTKKILHFVQNDRSMSF